jgi:hypothetical protein
MAPLFAFNAVVDHLHIASVGARWLRRHHDGLSLMNEGTLANNAQLKPKLIIRAFARCTLARAPSPSSRINLTTPPFFPRASSG